MKRFISIFIAVAALVASCAQPAQEFITTTGVTVTPSTLEMIHGDYKRVKAVITPDNASSRYLKWSSSASSVATVDGWGNITAVAPGTAVISVVTASGNFTGSCAVTVKPIEATSFTLDKTSASVILDNTLTLKGTIAPANASYQEITWHSTDPEVASVDDKGVITGKALGSAIITAKLSTKYAQEWIATCHVTVEEPDPTAPETMDIWKNDDAGSKKLYGPGETADKGWLKYADGKATWEANTTGKIRSATIELKSGSKLTVTQIGVNDFAGEWTLYAKLFDPNKTIGTGNVNAKKTPVTVAVAEGENGNNITLTGLYLGAAVEGQVSVDYMNKTAKLGVYVSSVKTYSAGNGKYCALLPECAGSTWGNYNFCPKADKAFSDTNYDWLWFPMNVETSQLKYQYCSPTKTEFVGQKTANGAYQICGLSFVVASETAVTGSSYDVIYQANYNGSNAESMYFMK